MKIAFIGYEYPPDTAKVGIATYVYQAAKMLHKRGHPQERPTAIVKEKWIKMAQQSQIVAQSEFNPDLIQAQFESEIATVR